MPATRPPSRLGVTVRRGVALAGLIVMAGCASHSPQFNATQEAAQYAARAKRTYTPPGPPSDPWGPYMTEAASRYDVPVRWVRAVMRQESGGRMYEHGQLITSDAGAMGLMQVMPATYDELRARYGLGDDAYDPHDNIMAGAAYMRELYDVYGSPAFLAAYNAGPGRLDDYLTRNRPLPDETRHYVARIAPNMGGDQPSRISEGQALAINQIPIDIPAGPRYPRRYNGGASVALASNNRRAGYRPTPVLTASLPEPPPPPQYAVLTANPKRGFHLISSAMADTLPPRVGGPAAGQWAVQVGAYVSAAQAHAAAEAARAQAPTGRTAVGGVQQGRGMLYRARLVGLSHESAVATCGKLRGRNCIVLSPAAQG